MTEKEMEITEVPNWKPKVLVAGGVLGALVGVAAAYLFVQSASSEEDGIPHISVGEGVKIGVLVFGLLRSIASLKEKEK